MHISFTMKYKGISKKNLKILKKLLFFDSGYYTSLEMDQEHSEDVSNNLSDHKITFFRFLNKIVPFLKNHSPVA